MTHVSTNFSVNIGWANENMYVLAIFICLYLSDRCLLGSVALKTDLYHYTDTKKQRGLTVHVICSRIPHICMVGNHDKALPHTLTYSTPTTILWGRNLNSRPKDYVVWVT